MAFTASACFACFRPLATYILPGNNHPKHLSPKALSYKPSIPPHNEFLSTPSKYYHRLTQPPVILDDELNCDDAPKLEALQHLLREIAEDDPLESLNMVDAIQRLGIDYHFREDIEAVLQRHYALSTIPCDGEIRGLHEVALRFRLLRQQGYFVPADAFEAFLDKKGHFQQNLSQDIKGLASLYEASQLGMQGEDLIEEAGNFSHRILQAHAQVKHPDYHHARFAAYTLVHPHHKSMSKFLVKNYFGDTQWTNRWINTLQQVAKMDFNTTQSLHQHEILQISQWWRDIGLAQELKFARDQPLKWYTASLVCLPDPCFSRERVDLAKLVSFVYLIDDIFDLYGSLDQLTLFTEAIQRWDLAVTDELPECMKICFRALYEITNEVCYKIYMEDGWNPIDYLRRAWGKLCNAFLTEAKWFTSGHSPSTEEYLNNGIISTGVHLTLVHVYFLLGQRVTEQTVELLDRIPATVSSTATILRLWDDMGSSKDENQDGHDGSYLEYYMKEHKESCLKATQEHVMDKISNEWKILNRECLSSNPFPVAFIQACLNICRMVPLNYSHGKNQSLPSIENLMESIFFEKVDM